MTWRSRRGSVRPAAVKARSFAMVFEVREVLEGLAARRAATLITPQQVEWLAALFAGIETTDTPAHRRAYLCQDYLFHSGILEIAESPPLSEATNSVNILVLRLRRRPDQVDPGRADRAQADYRGATAARSRRRRGGHASACAPFGGLAASRG